MEAVQYRPALAKTSAMRGSSKEKVYQELGLELFNKDDGKRLCCFYKILKLKLPSDHHKLVTVRSRSYRITQCDKSSLFNIIPNFFRNIFSPASIIEWNNLVTDITNSESIKVL